MSGFEYEPTLDCAAILDVQREIWIEKMYRESVEEVYYKVVQEMALLSRSWRWILPLPLVAKNGPLLSPDRYPGALVGSAVG